MSPLPNKTLDSTIETLSEQVLLPSSQESSAEGSLSGVLAYPESALPLGLLVVAGPHPLLGGTMENNVVRGIAEGLAAKGWITLRFDYSGAGDSDGESMCDAAAMQSFWEDSEVKDEKDRWQDLETATQWLRKANEKELPLVVTAYSFGNLVTANWLVNGGQADALVSIAPTLDKHDLQPLADSKFSKLAIAPDTDFATSDESTHSQLPLWKNTTVEFATDRDGHFFRGHEPWLCEIISGFLQRGAAE